MKKFFLIFMVVIGFELRAMSQNDCDCNDVKKSIEIGKKNGYIPENFEGKVYVSYKYCNGLGTSLYRDANNCMMVRKGFSTMTECKNWLNSSEAREYKEWNKKHNGDPMCFECIECDGSFSTSSSNSSSLNNSNSPLIPISTGNGTADAIVGGVVVVAGVTYLITEAIMKKNIEKKRKLIDERIREIDREIAEEAEQKKTEIELKNIEKQNKIELENLKNNIDLLKRKPDGYGLLVEIARDHNPNPLNFEDYVTRELWEKDLRDMSDEELNTFIREYNRFWKDYYSADELSLISDETKKELLEMGINVAEKYVGLCITVASGGLFAPVAGIVTNIVGNSIVSGTAEAFRQYNANNSIGPAVVKNIAAAALVGAASNISLGIDGTIGSIAEGTKNVGVSIVGTKLQGGTNKDATNTGIGTTLEELGITPFINLLDD